MTEIDTLIPAPIPLAAGGGVFRVMPLRVRQFGAMLRALSPVVHTLRLDTREVDLPALLACEDDVRRIVAVGLDTGEEVAGEFTRDQRSEALLTVLALNEDFFFPAADGDAEPTDHDLADTFQRLVESGHRWTDMQDYTLAQLRAFDAAAGRLRRERDRIALMSVRAAGADAATFKGWLAALGGTEGDNGE